MQNTAIFPDKKQSVQLKIISIAPWCQLVTLLGKTVCNLTAEKQVVSWKTDNEMYSFAFASYMEH